MTSILNLKKIRSAPLRPGALGFGLLALVFALVYATATQAQQPLSLPPLTSPASNQWIPGKFVWFDLATPGMGEQQAFYQDVFGWSYRSPGTSAESYVLILNKGSAIGGMFEANPPGGEQDGAAWLALMSVEDVDASVTKAKTAGATVEVAPASVAARGRHALLRDPAGAIFGVMRSSSGDPVDEEVPVGGIFWVDLFAQEITAVAAFYQGLAPIEVTKRTIPELSEGRLLHASGMPRAGIVPVDEEANRSAWVPYVRVNDVQATLDKAVAGGGFVIVAPDPQLLDGNLGIFVDPKGGVTGVVKWEYTDEGQP